MQLFLQLSELWVGRMAVLCWVVSFSRIIEHAYCSLLIAEYLKWAINNHSPLRFLCLLLFHSIASLYASCMWLDTSPWVRPTDPDIPTHPLHPSPFPPLFPRTLPHPTTLPFSHHDFYQPTTGFGRGGAEVWPGDWEKIRDRALSGLLHVLPLWNHLLLLW